MLVMYDKEYCKCCFFSVVIGRTISKITTKRAGFSDQRSVILESILRGIKAIKLNCWEGIFRTRLEQTRQ